MAMLRIAFPLESDGVLEIEEADLEAQVNDTMCSWSKRQAYREAEYVEADSSPYTTWRDIRRHGYTARAFVKWSRR